MKINLSKIALLILLVLTCTKKKPMFKEPVARLTIQSIEQLSVKLFKAITQNNCEEVQSILCSVQGEDHEKLVNGYNKDEDYDMTPLMKAAKEEKYAIAKALLEAGADANRVGAIYNNSYTPLKWTIKNKDVRMVKLLMEHGADLIIPEEENQIDKNLVTALQGLLEETIEAGDPTLLMCLSRLEEDKVGLNVVEVLAALIDERNTLSEDILSTMMKQAADEEQWTIVRSLLERANHQIREEAIEHTFAQAVNSRQTAILDSLLTNNALSEDILSTMMKQAADEEQWTIVRSLLERTSHQIREEAIEHTFARAVNSRQTAILDSLLTHENTREKLQRSHLQKALSTAAAYNQETVVDALIDKRLDKLEIEEDILPILKQAASSGKESIVKAFFNPSRGVRSRLTTPMVAAVLFKVIAEEEKAWPEEEERKMEEDKAAIKIANTLLRRLKELSVDKATIEEALIEATKQGKENIVAGIINLDKIDQPMIERAFREAIRTGKTNIGTHLLGRDTARQHIDKRIISSALLEAAELNQLPTLQELVSAVLPHIDQEAIVEVFNQAIAHNNSALLAALLVEEKTKELLGKKIVEAFKQARAEDKHAIVSVLLEKADNKLRDETVENAFLRAKQKNQVTMVGSLLQKGKIDSAMIADTFIEVVKEGKTAMVQVFLANAQLSGNTLKEAFNDVQAQNNSTLLTTFLQNQRVKESVDQATIDQAFTTVVEESKERKLESLTKHQHTQVAGFLNSDAVSDVSSLFKTALEKALKDDAEIALLALFLDHSLGKVSQEALEEALKEAVGKGKEEVVTCLVDKSKSQLREEAITQALTSAVAQGNAPMVDTLLDGLKDTTDISFPFNIAVDKVLGKNAEIALLTLFLDKAPDKVSQEALEEALKKAVEKGGKKVVTCLVDKSKSQLREEAITQALTSAVAHKNALMVGTLLEGLSDKLNDVSSPFNIAVDKVLRNNVWIGLVTIFLDKAPDKVSQEVLEEALKSNDPNRKRVTAAIYEHIKPQVIRKIFEKAVDEDNTALVERVLAEGSAKLAKEVIKRAFQSACQQGHSVIVGLFLRKGEVKNKLKELISSCFNQACKDGQAAVVGSFLANAQGSVPKDTLATAIVNAINDEQNEVKDTLLAQVKEKVVVKKAWKQGIEEPNTAVVKVILAHSQAREKIDRQTVRDAFTTATTEDQTSLVQVLLSKASDKIQETAIVTELGKAVENEEGEIVNTINTMSEETLGRVLLEAVKQGEDDLVSVLLKKANKRGSDITKAFSEAVRKALTDKEETLVAEFLNKKKYPNVTIGNQAISNALTEAVENGTDAMVSVLLKEANKRGSDITKAFSKAVERALTDKEEIGLVTTFLSKKKYPNVTIGNQAISNALTKAVAKDNAPIVGILLDEANENKSDVTEAFSKAVERALTDKEEIGLVTTFLSKKKYPNVTIGDQAINDALTKAVAQNNTPIVGILLDEANEKGSDITETFSEAVTKALADKEETFIAEFLNKEKYPNVTIGNQAISNALTKAVTQNNAPIVGILLAEANEKGSDITEAFSKAVEKYGEQGSATIISILLSKENGGKIKIRNCAAINDALTEAVAQNNAPIVGTLLDRFKDTDVSSSFNKAVGKALGDEAKTELVTIFLDKGLAKISKESIKEALRKAVEKRREEVVKALLNKANGKLEKEAITQAFTKAVAKDNAPIVGILLDEANEKGSDITETFSEAVTKALADKEETFIAEFLNKEKYPNVTIEDKAISNALTKAVTQNNAPIVGILLDEANKIDDQTVKDAFKEAVAKGSECVLDTLLTKANNKIDEQLAEEAIQQKLPEKNGLYIVYRLISKGKLELDKASVQKILTGNYYYTRLHFAVLRGDEEAVDEIINEDSNSVAQKDKEGNTPLHVAAAGGQEAIVKKLIEEKADVNAINNKGQTPPYKAIEQGHEEIVKLLIKEDNVENVVNYSTGASPLSTAAFWRKEKIVTYLIDTCKANGHTRDWDGRTPLYLVANFGHEELVKKLTESGANIHATACRDGFQTPLHMVAYFGKPNIVELLLKKDAQTGVKDRWGRTPLHNAALRWTEHKRDVCYEGHSNCEVCRGYSEVIRLLLDRGARTYAKDKEGRTPLDKAASGKYQAKNGGGETLLHSAVYQGDEKIVAELIAQGTRVDAENIDRETPLHWAAYQGYKGIVNKLLEEAKEKEDSEVKEEDKLINKKNKDGETPLHLAVYQGHEEIVAELIAQGARVNAENNGKETPLHSAAYQSYKGIVEKLLEKAKGLINAENESGETPLHKAIFKNDVAIVTYLLDNGADVKKKDKSDLPLLHQAISLGRCSIVEKLIRSDDDLYEKDYQDRTPLHVAVQRGSVDIVALLLERGAKLDEKDKAGKTPLQWAEMLEYTKIVNILKNRS